MASENKTRQSVEQFIEDVQIQLISPCTDNNFACQQMTIYLDQDDKLKTLDNELLNGDLGGDNDE